MAKNKQPQQISTMSKQFKSPAWKAAKRQRHEENRAYRAQLHSRKSSAGTPQARAVIQGQIDEISKRGAIHV